MHAGPRLLHYQSSERASGVRNGIEASSLAGYPREVYRDING